MARGLNRHKFACRLTKVGLCSVLAVMLFAGGSGGHAYAGTVAAQPASALQGAGNVDLNSLKNRLRNTDAIGFFDKLSLNGKIESLIENFRRLHQADGEATMASLAIQFAILIDETLALLRDGDQDLHARIQAARGGLWRLFSNPVDFAAAFEGENITLASNSDNRD